MLEKGFKDQKLIDDVIKLLKRAIANCDNFPGKYKTRKYIGNLPPEKKLIELKAAICKCLDYLALAKSVALRRHIDDLEKIKKKLKISLPISYTYKDLIKTIQGIARHRTGR